MHFHDLLKKKYLNKKIIQDEVGKNLMPNKIKHLYKKMENISFEEFQKIDLRIAKILSTDKVEGSEKLLKLKIDLGVQKRQIVAGIAKFYKPEELIGRKIVVITNLEPRTLMGLESQGMLLAANDEGKPVLLKPDQDVSVGTQIR